MKFVRHISLLAVLILFLTACQDTTAQLKSPVLTSRKSPLFVLPATESHASTPNTERGSNDTSAFVFEASISNLSYAPSDNTTLYVLMYHSFTEDGSECNEWTTTTTYFREDLQWLVDHGYDFVLPRELAAGLPLPEKAVMLTFDDGYADNYTLAYPILREFNAKALISIVASMPVYEDDACLSWEMCREMVASGLIEIGSHTYDSHLDHEDGTCGIQRFKNESRSDYEARIFSDLQESIDVIEENVGQPVTTFAYPNGQKDSWAASFIQEHFLVTLATVSGSFDISNGLYSLPRFNINAENRPYMYMSD